MTTLKDFKHVQVLYPVADAFSGTVTTTPVNLAKYSVCELVINRGDGAGGGASSIKAQLCDNAAGDNPVDVPFYVTRIDRLGAVTLDDELQAATGYTMVTSNRDKYIVRVSDTMADVAEQNSKTYLRLELIETVDQALPGQIDAYLSVGKEGNFYGPVPTA